MLLAHNPWLESPEDGHKAALARLMGAHQAVVAATTTQPTAAKPLARIAAGIAQIHRTWEHHPNHYRQHRRFSTIDAPDIQAMARTLARDTTPLDPAFLPSLGVLADRVEALATDAHAHSQDALRDLLPAAPVDTPPEGRLGRWGKLAQGLGKAAQDAARTTAAVGRSGGELAMAAGTWTQANLANATLHTLSSPKAALRGLAAIASGRTLVSALVSFGGMGLVTCIVFPPALPVMVGLSLLEAAASTCAEEIEESLDQDERAQQANAKRRTQAAKKMRTILGMEAPSAQVFGTDHIHVLIDPQTARVDARILSGKYAGCALDQLDAETRARLAQHAPDADTRAILTRWRA